MSNTLENMIDKRELLKKAEISLGLDDYDDIFSDFDPRPYSQRALSQDFIEEAKRAIRDKNEDVHLSFLIPEKLRDTKCEITIKNRILNYFQKQHEYLKLKKQKIIKQGIMFIIIGIMFMAIATYILFSFETNFLMHFLIILFEPGGWFFFWEGLNLIVFDSKELNEDLRFHKKLSKCDMTFVPY